MGDVIEVFVFGIGFGIVGVVIVVDWFDFVVEIVNM